MAGLDFPNAVEDEAAFFGRKDMLRQIQQILLSQKRTPIIIVGERRIGKTSLQNVAIQRLLSLKPELYQIFYIEPRGVHSYSLFALSVLRHLNAWLRESDGKEIPLPHSIVSVEDFELYLSLLFEQIRHSVLICVDEFDEIVRRLGAQDLALLIGALSYLVEKTSLPVCFFLTMTSIPHEMIEDIPSTLVSVSHVFELAPLTFAEMKEMVERLTEEQLDWTRSSLDELYSLTAGHPYFTKLFLYCLISMANSEDKPMKMTSALLGQAKDCAVHNIGVESVLSNLYYVHFQPEEREILLLLTRRGKPIHTIELERAGKHWITVAKRLARRHYLQSDDKGTFWDFKLTFLREWLKEWIEFEVECERYSRLVRALAYPEIEVDDVMGMVRLNGREIKLSVQEYRIMRCLAASVERLVSRDDLIEAAWGAVDGVTEQMIDTAIYRLRKKLNDQGQYIETKTGRGFILHRAVLLRSENH